MEGVEVEKMGILLSIPFAISMFFGCLWTLFYVDKLGRRYLILRTVPLLGLTLVLISISVAFSLKAEAEGWKKFGQVSLIIWMTLYLLCFSVGFQATPWIINSEIYPIHLAGTAEGVAAATHWTFSFLVSTMFLTLIESDTGKVLTFLVFSLFAAGLTFFVYHKLPETAG
jgi:MFS transporter, SP family, galactose:H+ symporter